MGLAKCLYIFAVATALALLVVWQSTVVRSGGYLLARLEKEVEREQWRGRMYRAQVSKLKSPARITRLLGQLGIELEIAPPEEGMEPLRTSGGVQAFSGGGEDPDGAHPTETGVRPSDDKEPQEGDGR